MAQLSSQLRFFLLIVLVVLTRSDSKSRPFTVRIRLANQNNLVISKTYSRPELTLQRKFTGDYEQFQQFFNHNGASTSFRSIILGQLMTYPDNPAPGNHITLTRSSQVSTNNQFKVEQRVINGVKGITISPLENQNLYVGVLSHTQGQSIILKATEQLWQYSF